MGGHRRGAEERAQIALHSVSRGSPPRPPLRCTVRACSVGSVGRAYMTSTSAEASTMSHRVWLSTNRDFQFILDKILDSRWNVGPTISG